ncbi:hypothetical protein ACUM6W_15285 [Acinetobacter tandoii]|uniref:hypothetical protein n=1 Tax=Acinetobacter tandoii TaxID=202954 RepID=UPI00404563DF
MNVLEKAHLAKELQGLIHSLDQRSLSFYEIAKSKCRLKEIFVHCDEPIFKKQILNFKSHMQPELAAQEFAQHSLYVQTFRGVFKQDSALEQALEQHHEMGWAILHRANLGFQIWYIPAPNRTALLSDWDGLEKNYAWMLKQQEIYAALKTDAELNQETLETSKIFKTSRKNVTPLQNSSQSTPESHSMNRPFSFESLISQGTSTQSTDWNKVALSMESLALIPKHEDTKPSLASAEPQTTGGLLVKTATAVPEPNSLLPQIVELGQWKCGLTALQFPQAQELALCSLTLDNVSELMPLLEIIISANQLERYNNQPVYLAEQINAQGNFVKYVVILGAEDQLHAIRLGNIVSQHYAYELVALKLLPNEQSLKQCKNAEQFFELYSEQAELVWNTESYQPFIPAKCVQKHKLIAFEETTANYKTPIILLKERQKIRVIHGQARLQLSREETAYPYILLDRHQGVSWQLIQKIIQTLPQPISASKLYDAIQIYIGS